MELVIGLLMGQNGRRVLLEPILILDFGMDNRKVTFRGLL